MNSQRNGSSRWLQSCELCRPLLFQRFFPQTQQATWHLRPIERLRVPKDELQEFVHVVSHDAIVARTMPAGYFDRTPTIHGHEQMMERLKQRSSATGKLSWNKPVRQENGGGHQTAAGTDYVVRKTNPNGKVMYWSWAGKKLLGYSPDVEIARAHCEAHHLGSGT